MSLNKSSAVQRDSWPSFAVGARNLNIACNFHKVRKSNALSSQNLHNQHFTCPCRIRCWPKSGCPPNQPIKHLSHLVHALVPYVILWSPLETDRSLLEASHLTSVTLIAQGPLKLQHSIRQDFSLCRLDFSLSWHEGIFFHTVLGAAMH